ncbi:MAG: aldehyde dehydrogenase family protein [Deltaproteobacteria bacterium]|nr:aldehyde dehydrogenase family protein [Deltaproteobacteria bacterium]
MTESLKTISPVDGRVFVERPLASDTEISAAIDKGGRAHSTWKNTPAKERALMLTGFVDALLKKKQVIAEELSWQMGRPLRHAPNELNGFEERARHMISIAEDALEPVSVGDKEGFTRFITRESLGLVFVIAPWNYPYLTSVNAIVPALMAGNTVLLKHSAQTPLVAERYTEAAKNAGLPDGVFQHLHLSHTAVARVISDNAVQYVAFTGSVDGGRAVSRAAAGRFIAQGLELGGKDPAYVRPDADLKHAVSTLVDGSYYNAGQSCCGIKRIYVHASVYNDFIDGFIKETFSYATLGNPLEQATTLGPVVRTKAAEAIRTQIAAAVKEGAKTLIDEVRFPLAKAGTPYMAPQALVGVTHSMDIMREETFGPCVGIMRVSSDDEAITLMNDNRYGLTACVFTEDPKAAVAIGKRVDTGTWFMNRCDYLDPALAWVGVKDSGRGCTLSRVGYECLTRPKSYHLKHLS